MKKLLIAALVAFLCFAAFASDANAVVCARGVYRADCSDLAAPSSGMARTTGTHVASLCDAAIGESARSSNISSRKARLGLPGCQDCISRVSQAC